MAYLITDGLRAQLIAHEGLRLKPYRCTSGCLTIGVGHNCDCDQTPLDGIAGWRDNGITKDQALAILELDLARCILALHTKTPWSGLTAGLSNHRNAVLVDLLFNPGHTKMLAFKRTIQALQDHDYQVAARQILASKYALQVAARQILASKYALQVSKRAKRLAHMMDLDVSFEEACERFPL